MLVKMLPDQIADSWDLIKYAVESSLPPVANEAYDKMNRILENLLNDTMQCWVSYREENEVRTLEAVVVTTVIGDYCSSIKSLLIYSLFGFSAISEESWGGGFETLSKWGKGQGCNRIIAYTDVEKVKEVVKSFGGEAKYTLVSLPL